MKFSVLAIAMMAAALSAGAGRLLAQPYGNDQEMVFTNVEVPATFQGGTVDDFRSWVQEKLVYYDYVAREKGISERQSVQFVVDTDGNVTDVEIIRGAHVFEDEIREVLLSSPAWEPAKIAGRIVRQRFLIPVSLNYRGGFIEVTSGPEEADSLTR